MTAFLFYLGFAALITHEMDAVKHREWQLLYFFRKLPDHIAASLFIGIHAPILALTMGLVHSNSSIVQQQTRGVIALFLIVHAVLHRRLEHHDKYFFHTLLSKILIYGGGGSGLLYFIACYWR